MALPGSPDRVVPVSEVNGNSLNTFPVETSPTCTHVRLTLHPDGGVARLRVHGRPVPDPALLTGTIDLAALESGGDVVDCSDAYYASARNLLMPGRARTTAEGWENARRRDDGNDHVVVRLAGEGMIEHVEIDTSYFVGNAPGWARLSGISDEETLSDEAAWVTLVPRVELLPDCRHRFRVDADRPLRYVRLDVYPDGGIARLRAFAGIDGQEVRQAADLLVALIAGDHDLHVDRNQLGGLRFELTRPCDVGLPRLLSHLLLGACNGFRLLGRHPGHRFSGRLLIGGFLLGRRRRRLLRERRGPEQRH